VLSPNRNRAFARFRPSRPENRLVTAETKKTGPRITPEVELEMNFSKLVRSAPFVLAAGFAGLALVACGSAQSSSAGTSNTSTQPAQQLAFQVVGPDDATVAGPDGAMHDVFTAVGGTSVKVGVPVTITITNKDDVQHSMTSPDLGLNIVIPAATDKGDGTISYTFTPNKVGSFRWFCALPCDTDNAGWDMTSDGTGSGQSNFMAGYISVTQ
jgi:heme/copper-type cytochrome/quinol oxidase subunit 2